MSHPKEPTQPVQYWYSDVTVGAPRIYLVDDAWFEGSIAAASVFNACSLGGLHDEDKALTALHTALYNMDGVKPGGDIEYLLIMTDLCLKYGFALVLSNFEGMAEHWDRMNQKGSVVLVDLYYQQMGESLYGLTLLHALMAGRTPVARIAVVTGGETSFREKLADASLDETWQPFYEYMVVPKSGSTMRTHLDRFVKHCRGENSELPVLGFLRSLLRAAPENWSHPKPGKEVPLDVPLRHIYKDDRLGIKALFHPNPTGSVPRYSLLLSVLWSLLETSGFPVSPMEGAPSRIRLPLAPMGMLWVAQVWNVLYHLEEEYQTTESKAVHTEVGDDGFVTLKVPLSPDRVADLTAALCGTRDPGSSAQAIMAARTMTLDESLLVQMKDCEKQQLLLLQNNVKYRDSMYSVHINGVWLEFRWKGVFQ